MIMSESVDESNWAVTLDRILRDARSWLWTMMFLLWNFLERYDTVSPHV